MHPGEKIPIDGAAVSKRSVCSSSDRPKMPDRYGKYSYYDTPDGKDAHKKAWYVSKNMAKLGEFELVNLAQS